MVFLYSCRQDEENPVPKGSIKLSFSERLTDGFDDGRIAADEAVYVVLTITAENGDPIFKNRKIEIAKFGENYLLEPILLEIGSYNITKFLVLNENEEIIMATPMQGSALTSFVDLPLPIEFVIMADVVTEKMIEVIETYSIDPEDLGYTSLSFNIVPTANILVSVFEVNVNSEYYSFIEASLTVTADDKFTFTQNLGDSINVVKIRYDYENYTFKVTSLAGNSVSVTLSRDDLDYHRTIPLDIILRTNSIVSEGIFTLIEDKLVKLDNQTGAIIQQYEIINFEQGNSYSALTFDQVNKIFYLIKNTGDSPVLAMIDEFGAYSEIGNITLNGNQIELAEALAFDNNTETLYLAASLDGGASTGDYWSESLLIIDVHSAVTSFVTTIITNTLTPESDTDDMVIDNGNFYFIDAAPPGSNYCKIFKIGRDDLIVDGSSEPDLVFSTIYYAEGRIAVTGESLYLTSSRSLHYLNLSSPASLTFVGNTHSESEFNGAVIRGVTYVK